MRVYNYYSTFKFYFSAQDLGLALVVLLCILSYGFIRGVSKSETNPLYQYYFKGLVLKMIGSLAFALVYGIYYNGGDTMSYWYGAEALKNVFYHDPSIYLTELFSNPTNENFFNHYSGETGWPPEWIYKSSRHFFICKVTSVIALFIPSSFLGITFFMGFICYQGIWKLFTTVSHHYPALTKNLQIGIFFLPSTLFWCSGIMKDTIVLAGICYIVHETDMFLRKDEHKNISRFSLRLIIWGWLIFSCKPYVIIALSPAWLLWMNYTTLSKIKSPILKYYLIPILFIGGSVTAFQIYSISAGTSEFSPDNILDKAMIVRNDFSTNSTYGTNRFKAQIVEKNSTGLLKVIPEAIISGLFRPFIWEAKGPFIMLSAFENLFILLYLIYSILKLRIFGYLRFIRSEPFLLFAIIFTILLAYMVGFTTILFGALVRFRTPFLPFFVSFIVISAGKIKQRKFITGYSSDAL